MPPHFAYAFYRSVETLARLLPVGLCWRAGYVLGTAGYFVAGKYRKLARRNLTIAFGGRKSDEEIRSLTRKHFATLTANLLTSLKIPFMSEAAVQARLQTEGGERIEKALAGGKGVIYALCHMGNWEVLSQTGFFSPNSLPGAMFQPLQNPLLNAHVRRCRERIGCRLFDRNDGFTGPAKWLRENNVLGILADQHAGDGGVWTPFFKRLASTTNLPALLSRRTGAPVLPVSVITIGPARWRLVIGAPLPGAEEGLDVAAATAAMNQALERVIRQSPVDWFWVHNRWKTPNPDFLLARYRRGVTLARGMEMKDLKRFHVVVRSPNWLGDACMAVPMVRAIRRGRPDLEITILTPEKLAGFWKRVPEADHVVAIPAKRRGVFSVAGLLRRSGRAYDAAVLCPNSLRSAAEAWLADIPRIVGYRGHHRRRLLDCVIPPKKRTGPVEHHVRHYLRIAWRLGADMTDSTLTDPLSIARPRVSVPRLGICAGAEYGPAKRWPLDRFAAAIKLIRAAVPSCEIVLFGAPGEQAMGEELEAMLEGKCRNLTGRTSLEELMVELTKCSHLLTNDTGTMHLAASLGTPVVAVFGSTEPDWTGPLGQGHTVIRRHVECSPCFLRDCPLDFRCMREISPEWVAESVIPLLESSVTRRAPEPVKPRSKKRR